MYHEKCTRLQSKPQIRLPTQILFIFHEVIIHYEQFPMKYKNEQLQIGIRFFIYLTSCSPEKTNMHVRILKYSFSVVPTFSTTGNDQFALRYLFLILSNLSFLYKVLLEINVFSSLLFYWYFNTTGFFNFQITTID